MSYSQTIFLAIVQGLTEFLPISSSGHLVIFQKLFGLRPPVLFDILVHVGTLGAVVVYFRKELGKIILGIKNRHSTYIDICLLVVVGTIPAAVVGLFLQKYIYQIFDSLKLVGVALLITSGFLFSTLWFKSLNRQNGQFKSLKWMDALFIGIFQALAIFPGISRSGSTVVSGLWRGLSRETAFQFSFCLAIPAILGALVLQIPELINSQFNQLNQAIGGMIIAGIVGYLSLVILKRFLMKSRLWIFGIYCFLLGIIILIFS
jgi:undecaprenyl-diphosphatase